MNLGPTNLRQKLSARPKLRQILNNLSWLVLGRLIRLGVGLIIGLWLARYLGPEGFGLLSFALAFTAVLGAPAAAGLRDVLVRDFVNRPSASSETLGTAFAIQVLGGLIAYALLLFIAASLRFDDSLSRLVVAIVGAQLLFTASDVVVAWFESQVQSKYLVIATTSVFLAMAAVKGVLIMQQAPLVSFAYVLLLESTLITLATMAVMYRHGPSLANVRVTLNRAKTLIAQSWPLCVSSLAIILYLKIDQIMLGQLAGDAAVGIYSAATRVSEVWYFIPTAIVASTFPSVLEAKRVSEQNYNDRLQRLFDLLAIISLSIAIPLTFVARPLMTLLFGDAYESAGMVLSIHVWAAVFVFIGCAGQKWLVAENFQLISLQRTCLGAISNILLNLALIPRYGPLGAAVATVISYGISDFLFDLLRHETTGIFKMKCRSVFNPSIRSIVTGRR